MPQDDTITAKRIKKVISGYKFSGNVKEVNNTYSTNVTSLKRAEKILAEYKDSKENYNLKDVKIGLMDKMVANYAVTI